jgi:hypothetical protein
MHLGESAGRWQSRGAPDFHLNRLDSCPDVSATRNHVDEAIGRRDEGALTPIAQEAQSRRNLGAHASGWELALRHVLLGVVGGQHVDGAFPRRAEIQPHCIDAGQQVQLASPDRGRQRGR